ncbi:hypothetical protein ACCO45_005651 [Purpureocillium lilacinum]|uniref:Uncharacterized protein n=1 Tax=Purpureocillium lilacinum TaxID=33203 RepID=A0ACC4DXE0_PURLI
MTSTASTATPAKHAFEKRVDEVKSPKSDINALILDYLTMEGYPNAAAKFSKEANLQPQQDSASIHIGRRQGSSLLVVAPSTGGAHPVLQCFGGDIGPALKFATEQLGPRAPTNPRFLEDLERTMALLLFPQDNLEPQLASLLNPDLRRDAADSVNRAILERQSARREAAIRHLVKMRAWAENTARDRGSSLPESLDIGLRGDDPDSSQTRRLLNAENGHEPMVTN